jgi:outer membrane protein assembly factor BamB
LAIISVLALGAPATADASTAKPLASTQSSFHPSSGPVGTTVAITGTGFTSPCSAEFNGVSATKCTVTNATTISTTVPPWATTGPISLTDAGNTTTSATNFSVTLGILLSPTSGPPTTSATVEGTGFNPNEAVDLYLGTTDTALVTTDANGNFTYSGLIIPASAQPGDLWVSAVGRDADQAAQKAFLVRTNWAESGYGTARHGYNPYENTLSTSNVGSLGLAWDYTTGDDQSSPAVVDGVVYVGSGDDNIYALNASTGALKWAYVTGGDVDSSPTVVGEVVYVGSDDDNLYALNASTGTPEWTYGTGEEVTSSPAVANGVVYVGSVDDNLYALNASSGDLQWSYTTGNSVYSSPAVANGVVYVGSADGNLYAFDLAGGQSGTDSATARPNTSSLRPYYGLAVSS